MEVSCLNTATFKQVLGMLEQLSGTVREIQLAARHAEKQSMQAPPVTPPPSPLNLAQTVFGTYGSSQRPTTNTTAPLAIENNQTIGAEILPPVMASNLIKIGTKIICVGRDVPKPKEMKPTSAYLENGGTIEIPESYESLDHEVELVVVISKKACDVPKANAMDYVGGYALALDMNARELQSVAKSAGLPWTIAKGQDIFTPIIQYSMFQLTLSSTNESHLNPSTHTITLSLLPSIPDHLHTGQDHKLRASTDFASFTRGQLKRTSCKHSIMPCLHQ